MNASDPVFAGAGLEAQAMTAAEVPALQAFLEANPTYFVDIFGRPPRPNEAAIEFADVPPPELPHRRQHRFLVRDGDGEVAGVVLVTEGLVHPTVWHTGLFIVADRLHGRGAARALHEAQRDWMRRGGAAWLRLGVVVGNARAERFWTRNGYREVRRREAVDFGDGVRRDVRVLVRPAVGAAPLEDYLRLVERDRPPPAAG